MPNPEETGTELAKQVSQGLNSYSRGPIRQAFCQEMRKQHRTVQQIFTGLCLEWLHVLSRETQYDGRNEASVKIAREIDTAVDLDTAKHLPLV